MFYCFFIFNIKFDSLLRFKTSFSSVNKRVNEVFLVVHLIHLNFLFNILFLNIAIFLLLGKRILNYLK